MTNSNRQFIRQLLAAADILFELFLHILLCNVQSIVTLMNKIS